MRDPDHLAPGNDAPAGSADAPAAGPATDSASKVDSVGRAVVAAAAGTTVNPLDRSSYAVATNRGYGDAMGRGLELALTLAVLSGIGWLIDRQIGTTPLFTAILSVVGFAGISVKLWIGYDLEMRRHDEGAIWNRGRGAPPADPGAPAATASPTVDPSGSDLRPSERGHGETTAS